MATKVPFNPYAAGRRAYGYASHAPNWGLSDKMGYKEREIKASARKRAVMRRLSALKKNRVMQPDVLRSLS